VIPNFEDARKSGDHALPSANEEQKPLNGIAQFNKTDDDEQASV